jgi:hypothetical protein
MALKGLAKCDKELMETNEKICGAFVSSRLEIYTTDPEFIKAVTIKDFNHFVNRNQVYLITYNYIILFSKKKLLILFAFQSN